MVVKIFRKGTRKNARSYFIGEITEKNTPLDVKRLLRYCVDTSYHYDIKLSNGWVIKSFTAFETLAVYDFIISYFIRKGEWVHETT